MNRPNFNIVTLLVCFLSFSYGNTSDDSANGAVSSPDLFSKFRIEPRSFRVARCPKAMKNACIQWKIGSRQNSQDSSRVLNITTVSGNGSHEIFKDFRITMSKEICRRYRQLNESLADCNFTIPLEECRNFLMRLGPDTNSGGISTVPIKASSLKVELLGIATNRVNLSAQLDIECESDYVSYVDFDIFDKSTSQRRSGTFNALCEGHTCKTTIKDMRNLHFCRQYSIRIDTNNIIDFNTPPEILKLQFVKFEGNKAFLNWSINPPECKLNPTPLIEKMSFITSNVKLRSREQNHTCTRGSCSLEFEVESCVNYVIYPDRLKSKSITVLHPSIFNVSADMNNAKEGEILLSWTTGCPHKQKLFTVKLKNELQSDVITLEVNATCTQNLRCHAAIQAHLTPCSRYQIQIEDSNDIATVEAPLGGLSAIRANATALYSNRNSLSLTVLFSEIKGNCAKYLADATFKILSNPPIEGLIRRNAVFQESSSVECIGVITRNRIIPPCESTIPLEVDPNFVGYNGYNQFDQLLRLNISMLAKVADNLKIDVMMEDLTAKAIGENLVIEWDDYSRCSASAHPSVNLRIVPDNLDSIKEHYEISVPASCFKHSNNSMHNVLFISGYSRVECPNDITKEYNINLLPCTTYNLSLSIDGIIRKRSKEVQFTTFLNEKALKQLQSPIISAKLNGNTSEIILGVLLQGVAERCVREITELEIVLNLKESGDYVKNLSCASIAGERWSISCAGNISPLGLDICEKNAIHLRTLHRTSPPSYWNLQTTQTISAMRNRWDDYSPIVKELSSNGSTAEEIEWSDPSCVLLKIDFWDVVISNETHEQQLRISRSRFQTVSQNSIEDHQYKIVTNDPNLRVTIQSEVLSNIKRQTLKGFELAPCSNYTVQFIPIAEGAAERTGLMPVVHFITGLNKAVDVKLGNLTSNNFNILISYPKRCLDYGLVQRIPLAKIDGHVIQPSSQDSVETCKNDFCFARWQADFLTPCTEYTVPIAGAAAQKFTTTPDSPRNLRRAMQDDSWIFKWDPPSCTKRISIVSWRFQLRAEEQVVADEVIRSPSDCSFIFQRDAISLQVNESLCFNISYQVAAIWLGNMTTWSKVSSFRDCLPNSSSSTELRNDFTPANVKSRDWPGDSPPTMSFEWDDKYIMPWVILFVKAATGFLILAMLVILTIIFFQRRNKESPRKRKMSETGLWLTELEPLN